VGRTTADPAVGSVARRTVLCLSEDPEVRTRLVSTCRGTGAATTTDLTDAATWWGAALVLLDDREAGRVGHLPRRDGVVLVHAGSVDEDPGPVVWRRAVAVGAEHVVVLPAGLRWLAERVRRAARRRGRCVGVVGARGGAGATSAAIALASTAAALGHRVLLLDADPLGGGVDVALGAEDLPGLRWPDLHDLRGPLPPGGLAASLPVADGVPVLSHGRDAAAVEPDAVRAVVEAALDENELLVVDLPRAGDETALAAVAAADALVCVCPAEVRAGAAAPAVLQRWTFGAPVHLLVRGPSPGGLRPQDAAAAVRAGLTLLDAGGSSTRPGITLDRVDVVRAEPGLAAALERGESFASSARSPLRRWATTWLAELLDGGAREVA
jgi:secretion/DNA translocation related CpaE-like protein